MKKELMGKCLCGKVSYKVPDDFSYALICHCSNCRRSTGSAFKPFAGIEKEKLSIHQGLDHLLIFGEGENYDTHCSTCGSLLFSTVKKGSFAHVTLGTLVDEPSIRPSAHIFVGSKASWFEINDDLIQYDEFN